MSHVRRLRGLSAGLAPLGCASTERKFDGIRTPAALETDAPEPGTYEWPTSGLFIDDYSQLPKPTTDLEKAKSDMDIYGYCESSTNLSAPTPQLN